MNTSEKIDLLATALSKAQAQLKPATKTQLNPFHNSKYADISEVWEACRTPLADNELCVVQGGEITDNGECVLVTRLIHKSGQWIEGRMPCYLPDKKNPQTLGSALTYNRRYGLSAILGITSEDDDGEAATKVDSLVKTEYNAKAIPKRVSTLPNYAPTGETWSNYTVDFGKLKGKLLKEIPFKEARNYCDWLRNQPKKSPKSNTYISMFEHWAKDRAQSDTITAGMFDDDPGLPPSAENTPWPEGM